MMMRRNSKGWLVLSGLLLNLLIQGGEKLHAQTWQRSGVWSDPSSWGGTLPTNDGTANLIFAQIGNPLYSHNDATLDQNWNVNSIYLNSTFLDNGTGYIDTLVSTKTTLTIQGGLTNASGGVVYIYPNIVLGATQTWTDNGVPFPGPDTYVYGTVSGTGGLIKAGAGTLRLNSQSNTYSGGTSVNGGVLEVSSAGSLGSGPVDISNATLRTGGTLTQNLTLDPGVATIQGSVTFASTISGSGQLNLQYNNSVSFTQNRYTMSLANSYSGGTIVGAVTLNVIGTSQSLGTGGVTLQSGAVLCLSAESNLAPGQKVAMQLGSVLVMNNSSINPANIIDSNPANTTGGTLSLTDSTYGTPLNMAAIGNGQLFLGSSSANVTYTATSLGVGAGGVYRLGAGSRNFTSIPTLTIAGTPNVLTGSNSVTIGAGYVSASQDGQAYTTVVIHNANDYSGGTTVASGIVSIGDDNALGSGTITFAGGGLQGEPGQGPRTLANAINVNSNAAFQGTQALTLNGSVNLGGSQRILGVSGLLSITVTNVISNGSMNINGGSWSLLANNTFAGGLLLSSGILNVGADGNMGAAGSPVTFQGGTLSPTTSFTTNRPFTISQYNGTIATNGQTLTLSGTVSGAGTLTKNGTGTLIFSGGNKTVYELDIKQGTLELLDTGNISGYYVVYSGAALTGNGSHGGIFLSQGANFSPGTDTPGIFTLASYLELAGGSVLNFDLGLTSSDEVILNHGLVERASGGGSSPMLVNISDAGGLAPGQTYTLFDWSNSGSVTIHPADLQLTSSPVPGTFSISNNKLQFTTVPEPSCALLLGAGVGLCVLKRKRQVRR